MDGPLGEKSGVQVAESERSDPEEFYPLEGG